nr:hypothetical protein [Tanacetum cinerariifolium]
VFNHWDWTSNGVWCNKGTRIIMGWNHNDVDVVVIHQDDQVIHTRIWLKKERKEYTWTQKPKGGHGILKKLDRIMANLEFNDVFMGAHTMFKPYCVSDHTPSVLCIPTLGKAKPKPFKFFNVLTTHELFLDVVKTEWDHYISGYFMFRVVKKLKNLKKPLRKLLYDKGNVHANVNKLRTHLDAIQTALDADPFNVVLREREATCVIEFNEAVLTEERFLKQKAKTQWLKEGSEFFRNGTLLKEINHTIIALLPKVKSPSRVNDYRPISCCNVLFKCISKIIANRIKHSLKKIISPNQSAFIPGRSITDNIILTHELMHNYHLERGTPRCAFKVNIQKAYDTVDWDFLRIILLGFGFHQKMVSWIMECVTSTSYSICINGSLHGYFKGKRILLQGDPISPYLFTLVMEALTLMLQRKVHQTDQITYHKYCSKMELVNLCFADDLFLFAYGDVGSTSIIKEALDEFKNASGLVPSLPKSTAYFCNVFNHVKLSILQILPFEEGKFPVKYLGVPLVSSRLMIRDCNELVDKVQICIQDWKNKSLLIAGRLQLIHSILGSMHIYQASVFILLNHVLLNIEQLMRQFLWSHGSSGKGKSKVAWEIVCLPKHEGGLGIRRLECFNSALMASHIWKLLTLKESLWSKIGNERNTSLWFDTWTDFELLAAQISPRDIARSGLSLQSKVQDVIHHGLWVWPQELLVKYPFLNNYNTPIKEDAHDSLVWRNIHGNVKKFLVSQVWDDIRHRDSKVNWYNMVWFPSCIPRHAINLWLIIRRKLKTQDLVPMCDVSDSLGMVCSFCESVPDSHDHLFFECPLAKWIWDRVKVCAGLAHYTPNVYDIIQSLMPIMKRRTTNSVVAKLVVAAATYYVWQERNWRLFKKGKRSPDQIVECIKSFVRLKILSCKLKKSKNGERLARLWDLPEAVFK